MATVLNTASQITGLTFQLIRGNLVAQRFIKSLTTNPSIILNKAPFYIPLEVETCTQGSEAEVSENLVVTADGKKYLTDNIAPGPWTWTISGYIPGFTVGEITNLYTPGLKYHTAMIKKIYREGRLFTFRDPDCETFDNVIIQSLNIDTAGDTKNKKPFQAVLKQVEILNASDAQVTDLEAISAPAAGTADGETVDAGQVQAWTQKGDDSMAYKGGVKLEILPE